MFMISGTDYTVYVLIAITFVLLFVLQYLLCQKTENRLLRAIPFLLPVAAIISAIISAASYGHNSGFIDLSMVMAGLLAIYALLSLIPILLARWVHGRRTKKSSDK